MGFFFNDTKAAAKKSPRPVSRSRDIPIASLNELGCSVCPRDKDRLSTPKMEPQGSPNPVIYVLSSAPTLMDDEKGRWDAGKVMRTLLRMLPRSMDSWVRLGGVIQCATDTVAVQQHEVECCRQRVVRDIEQSQPLVILGIGDAPLNWATGLASNAPTFRGRLITVKVGSHVCLYYPINYPHWVFKENKYGPSEQEVAMRHDIATLLELLDREGLPKPEHFSDRFDEGIECITGEGGSDDLRRLERALEDLSGQPRSGLDLETNGLRPWKLDDPMLLTAAVGTFERTVAFPLDLPEAWPDERTRLKAWSLFIEYLLNSGIKECHNLAFEMEWLAYMVEPRLLRITEWDDTMSMAHTIDKRQGTKSLDVQTAINYGFNLKAQSRVDVSRPRWWTLYPVRDILRYNGMDTKWTNKLSRTYRHIIAADPTLQYAHDRKVRLASTLVLTEYRGLPVDVDFAYEIEQRLGSETAAIERKIQSCPEVIQYQRKFGPFSPTNSDHVLKLLDKVCGREEVKRQNRDGSTKMTTDEEALQEIPAAEVPSAALVLEHRGLEKMLSTYVRPITSGKIISRDGMIHAKYSSMTAVTDRLAAEDPNAQNWPKRKHREIRGVVKARDKRWLLAADYGQIEFRVAGMASEDDNLVKYCWTGYDVHGYWAGRIVDEYPEAKDWIVSEFGVDWDEKGMKTLRQEAKNKWVFPSIFGAQVRSRAANLHLPLDIAEALDREFWSEFPGVKKWQQRLLKFYEKHLYVATLGGLRRYGPMSLNEIINMPIQGTAAEIVTKAMEALSERALIEDRMDALHPVLNVHDDLTFEPPDEDLDEALDIIVPEMCKHRFDFINVPLVVEVSLGERWSDLKEIGVYRSDKLFKLPNPYKD